MQCAKMMQTLVRRQSQSMTQTQKQKQMDDKPQLQPVLRHQAIHSSARSQTTLVRSDSASGHQGGALRPSSPASPCPGSTVTTGIRGGQASVPLSRASAGAAPAPVRAASGTPGLIQTPLGASLAAGIAGPADASGRDVPSSAPPGSASRAFSTSPRAAGALTVLRPWLECCMYCHSACMEPTYGVHGTLTECCASLSWCFLTNRFVAKSFPPARPGGVLYIPEHAVLCCATMVLVSQQCQTMTSRQDILHIRGHATSRMFRRTDLQVIDKAIQVCKPVSCLPALLCLVSLRHPLWVSIPLAHRPPGHRPWCLLISLLEVMTTTAET